ncbi:MAG: pyridoxal phosphate-dependent aminotransferase [Pseudomonadota bacterium]|nr:MAG: pyridoxal phosphate-dependent aminotransferase [Pseudomonadota bacterium]
MRQAKLAQRVAGIEPFHVMDILARARALESQGRRVIHMEIGEPDFPTPPAIVEAGIAALKSGHTHYTQATGLPALRQAIAESYSSVARPSAHRVIVTPGASGALALTFAALLDPGAEVLLADPGYPCNRQLVHLFGGVARSVPVDAASDYQLTAEMIRMHWSPRTVAVLLASPSNPTGTLVSDVELARIVHTVSELGGTLIVDEIYHGLTYGVDARSALAHSPDVFIVNSFSKYYGMTGWRLGWLVVPEPYVDAVDRLAQNVFLAPSTPAQHAALLAFDPEVHKELERRRAIFAERRDYLLPALRALGFGIPVTPRGAFYLYANCSAFTTDSEAFARELLDVSGVALTPGIDFGVHKPEQHVRFSYATELANLREGVRRIAAHLQR